MKDKLKAMLLQFVKPLVLKHLEKLDMLEAPLSAKIVEKTHVEKPQADALSKELINVLQIELAVLVNKI